jgi:hypothetical protein
MHREGVLGPDTRTFPPTWRSLEAAHKVAFDSPRSEIVFGNRPTIAARLFFHFANFAKSEIENS